MRTFYVATGLERAEEAKALAAGLREMGFEPTYEWWTHGSVQNEGAERIAEVATAEAEGVRACDFFVALLPGGRGTHTELGMAIAHSTARNYTQPAKRLFVVGPTDDASGRICAFYLHPQVDRRFDSVPELLAFLAGWRDAQPRVGVRAAP